MTEPHRLIERTVPSRFLDARRVVRILLPPSYAGRRRQRYPVLYVHDGQNVFSSPDPARGHGWGTWELDRITDQLAAEKRIREIILVAIEHTPNRLLEYRGPAFPHPRQALARLRRRPPAADDTRFLNYGRFLRLELKPLLDQTFRTSPQPGETGLLGSSLGGLCSLALAWQHPRTFGLVASLSGAFQFEKAHFYRTVLTGHAGRRKPIRIYLDSGFLDYRDDDGLRHTARVAAELRRLGWRDEPNLTHYVDRGLLVDPDLAALGVPPDKWREARQSQHNELYWRRRVWRALTFLFPPR